MCMKVVLFNLLIYVLKISLVRLQTNCCAPMIDFNSLTRNLLLILSALANLQLLVLMHLLKINTGHFMLDSHRNKCWVLYIFIAYIFGFNGNIVRNGSTFLSTNNFVCLILTYRYAISIKHAFF